MENNKFIEIILESILRLTPSERVEAVSDLLQIDDALKFQKAIMEICGKKQTTTAEKKPTVMRFPGGVTINLYEPVTYLGIRTHLLFAEDMSHVTAISKDAIREPTKWEVLKVVYVRLRHRSKGKGLPRNFFTNTWALFKAAPLKVSQASSLNDTVTAPEPPTSRNETECRPPQSGQTSSQHSCSMERNT